MLDFFKKFDNLVQHQKLQDDNTKAFFANIRQRLHLFLQKQTDGKKIAAFTQLLKPLEQAVNHVAFSVEFVKKQVLQAYEQLTGAQNTSASPVKNTPSFFTNIKENLLSSFSNFFKTVVNDKSTPGDYNNIVKSVLGGLLGFVVDFFTGLAKTILPKSESETVDSAAPILKQKLGSMMEALLPGMTQPVDPAAPAAAPVIHSPLHQQPAPAQPAAPAANIAPRRNLRASY